MPAEDPTPPHLTPRRSIARSPQTAKAPTPRRRRLPSSADEPAASDIPDPRHHAPRPNFDLPHIPATRVEPDSPPLSSMKAWTLDLEFLRPSVLIFAACALIATVNLTQSACTLLSPHYPASHPFVIDNSDLRHPLPIDDDLLDKKARTKYSDIWMSPSEVDLVLRYMKHVRNYFEWGSGGSTFNFPQFASNASVSVEHNKDWCAQVRRTIAQNDALKRVEYHCVPVPRGRMGWGIFSSFQEGSYLPFKDYIDEIDRAGHRHYDLILIDGRARVDAAIKALSYQHDRSVVILHDAQRIWNSRYGEVLKYYNMRDICIGEKKQGIAVLRRKPRFKYLEEDHAAVQQILNRKYGL